MEDRFPSRRRVLTAGAWGLAATAMATSGTDVDASGGYLTG